jgi:hypothetical protein
MRPCVLGSYVADVDHESVVYIYLGRRTIVDPRRAVGLCDVSAKGFRRFFKFANSESSAALD